MMQKDGMEEWWGEDRERPSPLGKEKIFKRHLKDAALILFDFASP